MKKNDILLLKTKQIWRVLDADKKQFIRVDKLNMPFICKEIPPYNLISDTEMLEKLNIVLPAELTQKQKNVMWKRYYMVQPLLTCSSNSEITQKIKEISEENECSKQTIRNYYYLYLAFNCIEILAPKERLQNENLTDTQKIFRKWLNRLYYSTKKYSLKLTYETMILHEYTDKETGELLEDRPSFAQFRYFKEKHNNIMNEICSRYSKSEFSKNYRNLCNDGTTYVEYPTQIYYLDATTLNVYLVDIENSSKVIGRCNLYAAIDVYSGQVAGISVLLESSVFSVYSLLKNICMDKKEYCNSIGIYDVSEKDWTIKSLPQQLVTDRGS